MNSENLSMYMPEVTDMELELLGTLLLKDGQVIPVVNSILTADDFFLKEHKIIFGIITDLAKRGIAPNILSITEELKTSNRLDHRMTEIVITLGEVAFSTAYAEPWAKKIKEYSIRRKIIDFSIRLNKQAANQSVSLDDIYHFTDSTLRGIDSDRDLIKPLAQSDFFSTFFNADRHNALQYSTRKTGFENIDENQIFSPGLYLLGATPACGKTTFCWQLLNQLAALGETCFFCSYEMSRLELFSKSLAREMFKRDRYCEISAADIRNGATSKLFHEVIGDLMHDKNSIQLFELRDESVDDLLRIIRPFCNGKDKSPVVCVDYLQIIPPSNDVKLTTDKARIDDIVHKLKTFQRDTNTTFIIISSFNRVNYYQQVSFESFKDSGNIEYTADVVWALQLDVANHIKTGDSISHIRKIFDDAKQHQPREIQLKCLKNRQGNNYDCFFLYFSAHDFFTPATFADFEANHANDDKVDRAMKKLKDKQKTQQATEIDNAPHDTPENKNVDNNDNDCDVVVPLLDDRSKALDDFFNSFN